MQRQLVLPALLCVIFAHAADAQFYAGYSGVDASYDEGQIDWPRFKLDSEPGMFLSSSQAFDKENDELKLYAGYRINRYFAIEAAYYDLGGILLTQRKIELTDFGPGVDARAYEMTNRTEIEGPALVAVAMWPIEIKRFELDLFLKAGVFGWTADSHSTQAAGTSTGDGFDRIFVPEDGPLTFEDRASESGVAPLLGAGVEVKLIRGLRLRAEVEVFADLGGGAEVSDLSTSDNTLFETPLTLGFETSVNTISGGLLYQF